MSPKRMVLLLVAVFALAGVAAGCGDDGASQQTSQASSQTQEDGMAASGGHAASVDGGAATLRANLTALLQEHVYLAGTAVSTGVGEGLDSKPFKAAAGTLDENSKELSQAIGSVYGDDAGKQFLALWRKHIGFFVAYTEGKATGDKAAARQAQEDLDGYRAAFGAFLASANPNLTKDAVASELKPHVTSLSAAIDAAVAGDTDVFMKLKAAAGHMPMTAEVLSGAIVKQFPDKFGSA